MKKSAALGLAVFSGLIQILGLQAAVDIQVEWEGCFGGSQEDKLYSVQVTPEGGYLLGGRSASGADGNKTSPNYGGNDIWIVRLDARGKKLWDKSFGGSGDDRLLDLVVTADGGALLGGFSNSGKDGNKTSVNWGDMDYWIVRLDANGQKLWDKSFGGLSYDKLCCVRQTVDGGFVLGGYSYSGIEGNKTCPNWGKADYWLLRLDSDGNWLWDKTYGGSDEDYLTWVELLPDGGFILGGSSASPADGTKTGPSLGGLDFWIVRVDAQGRPMWDKTFGGSRDDEPFSLQRVSDSGFLVGGYSLSSANGTKTSSNYGWSDFWLIRLDADGNGLWDKSYGGSRDEGVMSLRYFDNHQWVLAGYSYSTADGAKTSPNYGASDFWVAWVDESGGLLADQSFGGNDNDAIESMQVTPDGGLILGGHSLSGASGSKTSPNFGGLDYWVMKLAGPRPRLRAPPQTPASLAQDGFRLFLGGMTNRSYVIESSLDLKLWQPTSTNWIIPPELEVRDRSTTQSTRRFYRARHQP